MCVYIYAIYMLIHTYMHTNTYANLFCSTHCICSHACIQAYAHPTHVRTYVHDFIDLHTYAYIQASCLHIIHSYIHTYAEYLTVH